MMDRTILAAAGLILAGAITPGPNNFVVMREAARAGLPGVVAAIVGIVAGGLVLLVLTSLGIGAVMTTAPRVLVVVGGAGCLYLIRLGLRLAVSRPQSHEDPNVDLLPAGAGGLFLFQFLNPKAWLLVLTVSASTPADLGAKTALPYLIGLFVVIPAICLSLWSWAGAGLHRVLRNHQARTRLDRAMGGILIASAVVLFVGTWR